MSHLVRKRRFRLLTEEEQNRRLVAQLVASRIAMGLTAHEMLERIGYRYDAAPRAEKRGMNKEKWAIYRFALLEHELATDGNLSTMQRYARALNVNTHIAVTVWTPEARRRAARRHMRQLAARARKHRRGRRSRSRL